MSIKNWPGGLINDVPPVPSGPYENSAASGVWTLDQQAYWAKQGLWPTPGNVNPDAFIENLFSTYLYTGNGTADRLIENNIDLAGNGGLVWLKSRSGAYNNYLTTNATPASSLGGTTWLYSNTTDALLGSTGTGLCNFFANGFDINPSGVGINGSGETYASWTFRKQPKFFDVVTYTGNGASSRQISHSLGSTPGMVITKSTSDANPWYTYHRSLGVYAGEANGLVLNETVGVGNYAPPVTAVDSTTITVSNILDSNINGRGYVAYLFAHDAGGFGLSGNENVVSCGSYTGTGAAQSISLGYEPQWIMIKRTDAANSWVMMDNMRGMGQSYNNALVAQSSAAEAGDTTVTDRFGITSTGFSLGPTGSSALNASGGTYIYIAIRRGPMAVPTLGTTVFAPVAQNLVSSASIVTTNFPVDLSISAARGRTPSALTWVFDRIRGKLPALATTSTAAESSGTGGIAFDSNTSVIDTYWGTEQGASGQSGIYWNFRRAPSFFDEVCYTGNGGTQVLSHNLTVAPELIIAKSRSSGTNYWSVQCPAVANAGKLNTNDSFGFSAHWSSINSTSITGDGDGNTNGSAKTYVAYLFATCAGVSKVGSYTGTGTTQAIACGFTAGARFVMIKRTDDVGDWYVWDSARGIVAGNDPYLTLNTTAAEVTGTDYIDTSAAGFEITSTAPTAINAVGGSFIFLAIS